MDTQDDTFRKLAQRPFEEVRLMVRDMNARKIPVYKIVAALKSRGWPIKEYQARHMEIMIHEINLANLNDIESQ